MLNKIKNNIKNNKYIYLTFLLGIIIISIIFSIEHISPFGKHSTLAVDFYHQYGPMLSELYERVKNGSNLIYSFTMSSGLPFFRNFLNYLASPFNILLFLFKHENLLTGFSIIIGLKAVLSGTIFSYFITKKFKTKSPLIIALGLLYSFQAYFIAYYWNIMWIDGLVFIPLIALGIEKLVNENKKILYILSLSLMIITNYFIGYMLCIFSVIYFIIYLVSKTNIREWKTILKKTGTFILCSLIAGGLTAFLTLPLLSAITSTSATSDTTIPLSRYYSFGISEFIINHLTGVTSTVFSSDITNAPNISCGIITIPLLILFIVSKEIKLKTKICYLSALLFLIISFFFAPLDFIWHAFHTPNDLPYRFSFIYTFLLLTISSYSLLNIKKNNIKDVIIATIISLGIILFAFFFNIEQITNKMLIINAILIGIYFIIYLITKYYKYTTKIMAVIFIGVIGLENIVRVTNNWEIDQLISDFYMNYPYMQSALNYIKNNESDKFYRVEQLDYMTLNDSSWYNYNGITSFSSMNYEKMAEFQRDLGIPGNEINSFYFRTNTPIYNLMFNLKYIIGDPMDDIHFKNKVMTTHYEIYENKFNLNLMYGVNKNIKLWELDDYNPIINQKEFIKYTTNIDNVFDRNILINEEIINSNDDITLVKYSYKNNYTNNYFYTNANNIKFFIINDILYYVDSMYETINYSFPELYYYTSEEYNEKKIINFFETKENIDIYVGYNYYIDNQIKLHSLNENKFNEAYNILKNNEVKILDFKENKIKANINAKEDMTIYTSIPYDKGWTVYIDNKKIDTFQIGNALLGFDITKGNHNIKLIYTPKYLEIGTIISAISLIGLISITQKRKLT